MTVACATCAGWGELEATDMFSGAGGSSLGLESVCCPSCGRQLIRVTQALNHWDLAVEAHNANFPSADHDLHDVEVIPATRFRRTPLLWASPECTHHAYCRGPRDYDPDAQRSRATFGDIVRFTEHHRYDAVIVENVIEARLWCEAEARKHGRYWDKKEKCWAYRCSCGIDFDEWYAAMLTLGYDAQVVYFNSQFALPTPQSRDRMYVVFWRHGLPAPNLDFRPISWCSSCATTVRGIQTWKTPSKGSVRTQPGKFEWGRYGSQYLYRCPTCSSAVAPAVVGARSIIDWSIDAQRIGDRAKPLAVKTRERIRAGLERLSTSQPVTVQVGGNLFERRPGVRVWSIDDPLRTVVGTSQLSLVTPAGGQEANARSAEEPMHTVVGNDRLAIVRYGGQGASPRAAGEPMQTVTAHDRQIGLIVQNMEHNTGRAVDEPTPPVTTGGNHMLVSLRNHGEAHQVEQPAHTVVGGGLHHGLIVYNGVPGHVRELEEGLGVVKSRDSQSLLVPYNRTGVARTVDVPAGTVTTKDREALVVSEDDVDDCLFRMLQWHELLRAQAPFDHQDGRPYVLDARKRNARGRYVDLANEDRVKMIGNMVSSPVATMLGHALVFDTLAVPA